MTTPEKRREYNARYKAKKGAAFNEARAKLNRDWIARNREQYNRAKSAYRFNLKREIIALYSNGSMACAECGYDADIDALTLDHIENNGAEHRRELGCGSRGRAGTTMYERIKALGKLDGLQVLCANCNTIKAVRERRGSTSAEMLALPKPRWRKDIT